MSALKFAEPVSVLVGLGFSREIANVMSAYEVVSEWPSSHRGPSQLHAMRACRSALNGEIDAEEAREAFVEFAEHSGILVEEPSAMVAAQCLGKAGAATLR